VHLLKREPRNLSVDKIVSLLIKEELLYLRDETVVYLTGFDKKSLKQYMDNPTKYERQLRSIYARLFLEPSKAEVKAYKLPRVFSESKCNNCGKCFRSYNKIVCNQCHEKYENSRI